MNYNKKLKNKKIKDSLEFPEDVIYDKDITNFLQATDANDKFVKFLNESEDKFYNKNYGNISADMKSLNDYNIKRQRGTIIGIYPIDKSFRDQYKKDYFHKFTELIIMYYFNNDTLYFCGPYTFSSLEPKYFEERGWDQPTRMNPKKPGDVRTAAQELYTREKYQSYLTGGTQNAIKLATILGKTADEIFKIPSDVLLSEEYIAKVAKYLLKEVYHTKMKDDFIDKCLNICLSGYYNVNAIDIPDEIFDAIEAAEKFLNEVDHEANEVANYRVRGVATAQNLNTLKNTLATGTSKSGAVKGGASTMTISGSQQQYLQNIAQQANISYDRLVEKIWEQVELQNKNLKDAIQIVVKYALDPKAHAYFDSKKKVKDNLTNEGIGTGLSFKVSDLDLVKNKVEEFLKKYPDFEELIEIHSTPNKYDICGIFITTMGLGSSELKILQTLFDDIYDNIEKDQPKVDKVLKLGNKMREVKLNNIDDEDIDDIVFAEDSRITIDSISKKLMEIHKVKSLNDARNRVKDYIKTNAAAARLFDMLETFSLEEIAKSDSKFKSQTSQGWEILKLFANEEGRLYALVYRPKTDDYAFGAGYSIDGGYWNQGYYDYPTQQAAERYLYKRYGDENLREVYTPSK